jgi:tetratricopeptide (TPR) repeat protein
MGLGYGLRSASTWGWAGILLIVTILGTARWSWASQAGEKLGLRDAADPTLIYSDESQYSHIRVYRASQEGDVRAFLLDTLLHSQIDMQDPGNFQYGYEKVYASVTKRLFKGLDRVDSLTIGGGGYVYPRYMEATWPAGRTEVAEIDPAVTEAAKAAFGMPRDSKIICHDEDGRVLIDRMARRQAAGEDVQLFDVIYCDAVNDYSVPFQLTSVEFVRNIHAALRPDGAYLMNMIDIYNTGGLLGSMVSTLGEVFEHVYVFVEGSSLAAEGAERDTFVILGVDDPFDATDLGREYRDDCRLYCLSEAELTSLTKRTGEFVLTDDYSPVENLLAPVVKDQSRLRAAGDFEVRAERLIQRADFVGAIRVLEPAIARLSDQPRLRNKLGYCLYRTDRYEEAAIQFRLAIVAQPRYVDAYYNLGNAMFKQRKAVEAAEAYAEAVRLRPTHADAFFNLGNSLAALGRLKEAAACYEQTLQLKPDDADARHHLDVVTQKIPASAPAS